MKETSPNSAKHRAASSKMIQPANYLRPSASATLPCSNAAAFVAIAAFLFGCSTDTKDTEETNTCQIDTTKTGFELAAGHDGCAIWNAQRTTAHIQSTSIEVRATELPNDDFGSAKAALDASQNWVQAYYTFHPEDLSDHSEAPASIDAVLLAKMKSKEHIESAFGLTNTAPQGLCADAQQNIHDTVLNTVLTDAQRQQYQAEGKQLKIIKDDDVPPLSRDTNPVAIGGVWLPVDPASMVGRDGEDYTYEPMSLFIESDDPNLPPDAEEGLKGVRYCKLLTHQLILSWMLYRSFDDDPVLLTPTPTEECDQPSSFTSTVGSCFFYFSMASNYYCSDYTGSAWTPALAEEQCGKRTSSDELETTFSEKQCSDREDEISAAIPEYAGFQGACIIDCKDDLEFIWNVYQEDPEPRCAAYPYFSPEEKTAIEGS